MCSPLGIARCLNQITFICSYRCYCGYPSIAWKCFINYFNPIWVKCGVISAGAISSNVSLGVNDSHPYQDFSQEPDEYNFDPDPGTNSNSFYSKLQGNLPFCFILLCGSIGPKIFYDPYLGSVLLGNSGE